jgi:hypothetical protein
MSQDFTESIVEQAALAWLEYLGWTVRHGPEIVPGEPAAEHAAFGQSVLEQQPEAPCCPRSSAVSCVCRDAERFIRRVSRPLSLCLSGSTSSDASNLGRKLWPCEHGKAIPGNFSCFPPATSSWRFLQKVNGLDFDETERLRILRFLHTYSHNDVIGESLYASSLLID